MRSTFPKGIHLLPEYHRFEAETFIGFFDIISKNIKTRNTIFPITAQLEFNSNIFFKAIGRGGYVTSQSLSINFFSPYIKF